MLFESMLVRLIGFGDLRGLDRLAGNHIVGAFRAALTVSAPAAVPAVAAVAAAPVVGFGLGRPLHALLFLEQRLPVGNGDLIVVRMNFREGEEAVAIAAVVDEGRLQ